MLKKYKAVVPVSLEDFQSLYAAENSEGQVPVVGFGYGMEASVDTLAEFHGSGNEKPLYIIEGELGVFAANTQLLVIGPENIPDTSYDPHLNPRQVVEANWLPHTDNPEFYTLQGSAEPCSNVLGTLFATEDRELLNRLSAWNISGASENKTAWGVKNNQLQLFTKELFIPISGHPFEDVSTVTHLRTGDPDQRGVTQEERYPFYLNGRDLSLGKVAQFVPANA